MIPDFSQYPKLSREQLGHLRHFHNLASQLDGEWHHMGGQESQQEFVDAYRYQIATMTYAAAAAHYHHQPILRSVYNKLIRQLIHKMLLRDVWGYWFNTSLGGTFTDPDLKELRRPWADPIVRENIMYSGHLLLMVSLYAMLFDDDEFERGDSLVFNWNPLFWGLGPQRFSYNTKALQDAIMREMERNNYIGVCCEPNAVFIVCNQFPVIAIHYNDVRHGTSEAEKLIPKYLAAWERKGMFGPGSLYPEMWLEKQNITIPARDVGNTAWANAFMHAWRPEFVESLWAEQSLGTVTSFDSKVQINPPVVANAFRALALENHVEASKTTYEEAKRVARSVTNDFPYTSPTLGYVLKWMSELGRPELSGLLEWVDEKLRPTWENGGLYYPRHDKPFDDGETASFEEDATVTLTEPSDLEWTHMDPFTGNAAIGYARLNVQNGQTKMWNAPWTAQDVQSRPFVDGVDLDSSVDFPRAVYDETKAMLLLTVRSWDGKALRINPIFKNLPAGNWRVIVSGKEVQKASVVEGGELEVEVVVETHDLDIAVLLC